MPARSPRFVSLRRSWTSLAFSLPSFLLRSANRRPSSRSLSLFSSCSIAVAPSHSCGYRFSLARTLPPEYYVLTEIAVLSFLFVSRMSIPLLVRASLLCLSSLLSPSFHPQCFPPTIASHPPILSRSTSRRYSSSPFHSIYPSPSFSRDTIPQRPLSSVPVTQRRTARLNSYSLVVRVTFEPREQIRRCEERKRKEMLAATRKKGKR